MGQIKAKDRTSFELKQYLIAVPYTKNNRGMKITSTLDHEYMFSD
jgi:hypothetical protein